MPLAPPTLAERTSDRHRWYARASVVLGIVSIVGVVGAFANLAGPWWAWTLLFLAGAATSAAFGRASLGLTRSTLVEADTPGDRVGPARRPVLFFNPASGGGKAVEHDLESECAARGIEAVELGEGDDLRELAEAAVARGADVLGMAGGDGSQALVAGVAAEAGIGYVCIPAGTRNHLALDLGVDRNDVVGSLDAFGPAAERWIDLAEVNGRVFVNNVSLGAYAEVVQSDDYRDAKVSTTVQMLPELVGRNAEPLDLRYRSGAGEDCDTATVIQVSNNAYELQSFGGLGSRPRLDAGELGIVTLHIDAGTEIPTFVALALAGRASEFGGFAEWTCSSFVVDSAAPIPAGVDGEALLLDPPLNFRIRPRALRVRVPHDAPGLNPAQVAQLRRRHTPADVLRIAASRGGA